MKRILPLFAGIFLLLPLFAWAAPQSGATSQSQSAPPATPAPAEFLDAADEVLAEMSRLLVLPVKASLKKSIRTKAEIRSYILRRFDEVKEPDKRYADQKALEKFGLIPKGFDLDGFLLELLTEQVAGLYDPKGKEFFIADWIGAPEQRMVMAHELVHALHDQHFNVDPWLEAAKPNDDALLARDAVLEGAALAGMIDYLLRGQNVSVRSLPDIEQLIRRIMVGDLSMSPQLAGAPPYVRDTLLFPYLSGTTFTQHVLRANAGWADFGKVFENPPVSTQQILHPELYLAQLTPRPVSLPDFSRILPAEWKKLDENILGEFGTHALLKQFLGPERAERLARGWAGDRYAIFERAKTKELLLVFRLRLASEADAAQFFGSYAEALELKYAARKDLFRRPNFFSFSTDEGGVFLRCVGDQCLSAEGTGREVFDRISRAIGWPPSPRPPARSLQKSVAAQAAARGASVSSGQSAIVSAQAPIVLGQAAR